MGSMFEKSFELSTVKSFINVHFFFFKHTAPMETVGSCHAFTTFILTFTVVAVCVASGKFFPYKIRGDKIPYDDTTISF